MEGGDGAFQGKRRPLYAPPHSASSSAPTLIIMRATALARERTRRKPRLVGGGPTEQPPVSAVADEIAHEGPVLAFERAHAAIAGEQARLAVRLNRAPLVAGVRPFPDVAGKIGDAMRVEPEMAERLRRLRLARQGGIGVELGEPAAGEVVAADGGRRLAAETFGSGVSPFLVGRQAPALAGRARIKFGVGGCVEPAHADDRQVLRRRIDALELRAGASGDAARVFGLADRLDHDVERRVEPRRARRRVDHVAVGFIVAERPIGEPARLQSRDRGARRVRGRMRARRERGGGASDAVAAATVAKMARREKRIVQPSFRILRRDGARCAQPIGPGRRTWVIRSSFHLPSTRKCAVAPSRTASIRL